MKTTIELQTEQTSNTNRVDHSTKCITSKIDWNVNDNRQRYTHHVVRYSMSKILPTDVIISRESAQLQVDMTCQQIIRCIHCRALTKRSISQNFQNEFFCIIHISLTFSILCQKILAENRLQSSFLGSIKTLYPIFRVGFDNQNTLSNVRVYNTYNLVDNLYF